MKKIEERLNESIRHALERRPSDMGAWERFTRRVDRRRLQRFVVAGLAAAAVIAAAVIVVPRLGDDRTVTPIETPSGSPTSSPSPSPTPVNAVPSEVVALSIGGQSNSDDRVVVISTATGDVVRVLAKSASGGTGSPPFNPEIALSPDRSTVYFVRLGESFVCDAQIVSVPIAGGEEKTIVNGSSPAISPDGRYLAYSGRGSGPNCDKEPLIVRDMTSGSERRWAWAAEDPENVYEGRGAFGLSWAADSRHLAFYRSEGDPQWVTWVLDTDQGSTLLDAEKVGRQGEGWANPVYLKDGSLALVHTVRSIHDIPGGRHRILNVDTSGDVRSVVLDPDTNITSLAVDRSGNYLVFASLKGLFRVEDGKATRIIAGQYQEVAW